MTLEIVGLLGTFKTAAGATAFLCTPVAGAYPHVAARGGRAEAAFAGSVDEYIAAHEDAAAPGLRARMKNRVRRCVCGKSVACTLSACNLCGAALAGVPVTLVDNVFAGFVAGVARCAQFPLTISLREETRELLVFDDLLALSPCHLNVVPAAHYIPDWRYLLRRPKEGLALVGAMHAMCAKVLREQFLADHAWRKAVLRDGGCSMDDAALLETVAAGFNMPPSQYQLHMQFIMLPLLPYQHLMLLRGNHFTPGRFFPLEYVVAVLEKLSSSEATAAADVMEKINDDTPVEELVGTLRDRLGVDYTAMHARCCERIERDHARLANWRGETFEAYCDGDEHVVRIADNTPVPGATAKSVAAADKLALQNYGRPYGPDGKPTGSFYSFPRKPSEIDIW